MADRQPAILIVEDEGDIRSIIAEKLTKLGYQVYQAADGQEGLEMAERCRPDLIVTDLIMPRKGGHQMWEEIRSADFGRAIPFIILTAREGLRDYYALKGVAGFLEKPFKIAALIGEIERVLR